MQNAAPAPRTVQAMAKETAISRDSGATAATGSVHSANTLSDLLKKKRPLVMGVLNVTPDSFSDGGRFLDPEAPIARSRHLAAEAADILDVGPESSRPYPTPTPVPLAQHPPRLPAALPP